MRQGYSWKQERGMTVDELKQARMFYLNRPDAEWDDVAVWAIEQVLRAKGEEL